jgi:hypothetical protein
MLAISAKRTSVLMTQIEANVLIGKRYQYTSHKVAVFLTIDSTITRQLA